jgi:inhibitor of cysteine peptidase
MRQLKISMILLALFVCSATYVMAATEYTEEKPVILVQSDQPEFLIKLKSNPTTGYSWFLRSYDADLLQAVNHVYMAPTNKKLIGAPGYEIWTFKVKSKSFVVPMQTFIRFVYARPWEENTQEKLVVFQVTMQKKLKGE